MGSNKLLLAALASACVRSEKRGLKIKDLKEELDRAHSRGFKMRRSLDEAEAERAHSNAKLGSLQEALDGEKAKHEGTRTVMERSLRLMHDRESGLIARTRECQNMIEELQVKLKQTSTVHFAPGGAVGADLLTRTTPRSNTAKAREAAMSFASGARTHGISVTPLVPPATLAEGVAFTYLDQADPATIERVYDKLPNQTPEERVAAVAQMKDIVKRELTNVTSRLNRKGPLKDDLSMEEGLKNVLTYLDGILNGSQFKLPAQAMTFSRQSIEHLLTHQQGTEMNRVGLDLDAAYHYTDF
jgi:hypothetical protein